MVDKTQSHGFYGDSIPLNYGGSISVVTSYLVCDGAQWHDSVSSARVDPALNGYLEKSREGKQEG